MDAFPFDTVGFDLDGTLVDSSADLAAAVNHALALAGRPAIATAAVRPMIGRGARHMLEQALLATGGPLPDRLEALHTALLDFYAAHIAVHTRPYPGVLAALDELAARGARLAVVTNKREGLARQLLDALDLTPRFDAIIGGDAVIGAFAELVPTLSRLGAAQPGR
jgi:phosphoglycolate phosphatase